MAHEAGRMSAKKRKHQDAAVEADAPSERYHPGPEFKEVKGALAMDMAAIKSGDKELWLLQLPKTVSINTLNGVAVELDVSHKAGPSGASMGVVSMKDGRKLAVVQESGHLSQQMFVVAGSGASGDAMSMLPVSRRVTLEHVEEGPLPLPVAKAVHNLPDDEPATAQQPKAAGSQPTQGPSASKKEKKEKKHKHDVEEQAAVKQEVAVKKDKKDKKKDKKDKRKDKE